MPGLVDALSKHVGRQARQPSWQRRLMVGVTDGAPLLSIEAPVIPRLSEFCDDFIDPARSPINLASTTVVLLMADACQLLESEWSPEKNLAARHARAKKRADEAKAVADAKAAKAAAVAAEIARLEKENAEFHGDDFRDRLDDVQRLLVRVALAVSPRDKHLAAAIRGAVNDSLIAGGLDFPRGPWFDGIEFPKPKGYPKFPSWGSWGSCEKVLARIPPDALHNLRLMHGDNDGAIARQWVLMCESNAKADERAAKEAGRAAAQTSPSTGQQAEARARARRAQEQNDREMDAATATSYKVQS
jgi:hypothetical protein